MLYILNSAIQEVQEQQQVDTASNGYKYMEFVQVSDVHGWVAGHPESTYDYGDFGTLKSYLERVQENISNTSPDSSLFFCDGGDLTEGTIYSEGTEIPGTDIMELMSEIQPNLITVGNHDIGNKDRIDYLMNNMDRLFGDRYVTTNVFTIDNSSKRVGQLYNYQTLDNGLRILSFGFLYYSSTTFYKGGSVVDPVVQAQSKEVEDVIDQFGNKTDIVILDDHMSMDNSENKQLYQIFRDYFNDKFNHEVPIILVCAHDHREYPDDYYSDNCKGNSNCYSLDAGCYMQYINHVTFTIGFNETTNKSYIQHTWYLSPQYFEVEVTQNGTEVGLASRFNLTAEDFDTPDGLQIRQQVYELGEQLEVNETIGYANTTYKKSGSIFDDDSMMHLYMYGVVQEVIFRNDTELPQQAVIASGSFRANLNEGNITNNDAYSVMPFPDEMLYFSNLSCPLFNCLILAMNGGSYGKSPSYGEYANCTEKGWDFMDVVIDDYYGPRMNTYMDQCNETEHELLNYEMGVPGLNNSLDAYIYYIKHYMQDFPGQEEEEQQQEEEEEQPSNNSSTLSSGVIAGIVIAVIVVVAALCVGGFFLYRYLRKGRYEAIKQDVDEDDKNNA